MPDHPNTRHGHARRGRPVSPTYYSWIGMVRRCTNPNTDDWELYGGRGITVCDRWRVFANFLADMGERPPGMTINRRDSDKGYGPDNCEWADAFTQARDRRPRRQWELNPRDPDTGRFLPKDPTAPTAPRPKRGPPLMPTDTIRRDSRLIPGLKARLTVCTRFDADNQYQGKRVDPKYAWEKLEGDKNRRSRLTSDGDVYTIHVHGRLWYELREALPGEITADARRRVRAAEGRRRGQRGIVDGPPQESVYLPITWDDGHTDLYHAASVATVTDDPVCAAGGGCHMRFDGTVWYAVDSEVGGHRHELPGWAAEEYEADQGRLAEAAEARAAMHVGYWRVWQTGPAPGQVVPVGGGGEEFAAGSAADRNGLARARGWAGVEYVALPWPQKPRPVIPDAATRPGDPEVHPALADFGNLAAAMTGLPDALSPPEPTAASVAAVWREVGLDDRLVSRLPERAPARAAVVVALKRGWQRGHDDTLHELASDDEPDAELYGQLCALFEAAWHHVVPEHLDDLGYETSKEARALARMAADLMNR